MLEKSSLLKQLQVFSRTSEIKKLFSGLGQRIKNLKEVDSAKQKEAKSYDELVEYLSDNCR